MVEGFGDEAVAEAAHRFDEGCIRGGKSGAHPFDRGVHDPFVAFKVRAPYLRQQGFPREDPAAVRHQELKQLKLTQRQRQEITP